MRESYLSAARLCVCVALCAVVWCGRADASTYYVATSGGSDARSCSTAQTIGTPKQTINSAVLCLSAGDTLLVRAGTYDEYLNNVNITGTSWSNKIRIAAYPGETVWMTPTSWFYVVYMDKAQQYIEFDGINMNSLSTLSGVVKLEGTATGNPHHIRMQNAEIIFGSFTPGGAHVAISTSAQVNGIIGGNEFINLRIHGEGDQTTGPGVTLQYAFYINSSHNLIDHCELYDLGEAGLQLSNSYGASPGPDYNVVSNTVVHDVVLSDASRWWGIVLGSGNPTGNLIYNNVVYRIGPNGSGAGSIGILALSGTNNEIYNNTVYGNAAVGPYGIFVNTSMVGTTIRNNILYQNASGDLFNSGAGTVASNNLSGVDPKFVNAGGNDFHLQSTSPAIDAGMTITSVTADIAGVPRPKGIGYDIGAYEYVVLGPVPAAPTNLRIVPD